MRRVVSPALAVKKAYARPNPFAEEEHGLLNGVAPIASLARQGVRGAILRSKVASEALIASVEAGLLRRLRGAAAKTMVVELGAAARRKLLVGADAEQRFAFFCAALKDQSFAGELMAQHPVLTKRLTRVAALWRHSTLDLLARLEADAGDLPLLMQSKNYSDRVVSAEELGDPHGGGQCVQRLTYESGSALIYKPRPVAMEAAAKTFIDWSNRGLPCDLLGLDVLDRGHYGWVRHLTATPCADEAAVRRFFHRQGANLALSYVLGATDLHFENVLAVGEYPVIVDWETLFQVVGPGGKTATEAALRVIADSLARTLLLPTRIFGSDDPSRSADLSALGYASEQIAPFPSLVWEDPNSDAMRLRHEYGPMGPASSLPLLDGKRVPAASHLDKIEQGFSEAYDFYAGNKRRLLAPDGPLRPFRGRVVRHVFRATALYAQWAADAWHPRFGADLSALRSFLRENLKRQAAVGGSNSALMRAEIAALIDGDIPFFTVRTGASRAPLSKTKAFSLPANGWRRTQSRIRNLNRRDRERQSWFLRLAFADPGASLKPLPRSPRRRQPLLDAANDIGDRITELAIERRRGASWITPVMDPAQRLTPLAANFGLYSGLSGIALFLAALSGETGSSRKRSLAKAAIDEAIALHRIRPAPGFYEGGAGLAFVLARLGLAFSQPAWISEARRIIRAEIAEQGEGVDLLYGQGGTLLGATVLAEMLEDASLLPDPFFARALERKAKALPEANCGLAHGRAGIGYALMRWANAKDNGRIRTQARQLMTADIMVASSARRSRAETGPAMLAWCRGGLGASWALMRSTGDARAGAAIMRVLRSREKTPKPLCPCHGQLGVLDFLIDAKASELSGVVETFERVRREVLQRLAQGETCADHGHRIESPGLMLGLAGSGFMLLRLLRPKRIPGVLVF
jgi:type 2 lantibiotic biosynthesis protein LanM